jgi:hypothetical protein
MTEQEGSLITPAHRRLLAEQPGYAEFNDHKLHATSPAPCSAAAWPEGRDRGVRDPG